VQQRSKFPSPKNLVTQVPKKRNEPLTSIPGNKVPVDTSSEHPKVVVPPGSSGRESEVSIDWEDLLIGALFWVGWEFTSCLFVQCYAFWWLFQLFRWEM
jgi:hypothetical protein